MDKDQRRNQLGLPIYRPGVGPLNAISGALGGIFGGLGQAGAAGELNERALQSWGQLNQSFRSAQLQQQASQQQQLSAEAALAEAMMNVHAQQQLAPMASAEEIHRYRQAAEIRKAQGVDMMAWEPAKPKKKKPVPAPPVWTRPRAVILQESVRARSARWRREAQRELDLLAPEGRTEPSVLTWWERIVYWLWLRYRRPLSEWANG